MAWLTGYNLRKKLTIDHTKIDELIDTFQARVFIDGDADIGASCNPDGHDIRFCSADGETRLCYERSDFAVVAGLATGNFWVKISNPSPDVDTDFYIYYRPQDTADGSEEEEEVWDYKPRFIFHCWDTPGLPYVVHDSSSRQSNAVKISANVPLEVAGKIGRGYYFNGSDYFSNIDDFEEGTSYTLSGIVKFDDVSGTHTLISYCSNTNYYPLVRLECYQGTARFIVRDNAGNLGIATKTGIVTDTWYHFVGVRSGNTLRIYVNAIEGTLDDSETFGIASLNAFDVGAERSGSDNRVFHLDGIGDEFRWANVARTVAWIKADFNSSFNTLLTYGEEEQLVYPDIPPFMEKDLITPYSGGAWLWLCEIAVPGYTKQYLARNTEDIEYFGKTYKKFNLDIGKQEFSGGGSIPRIQLRIGQDPDKVIEGIVNASEGAFGGTVKLIRVNEKYLNYRVGALEINYGMLIAESDTEWVYFTLGIPNPLTQRIPLRVGSSKVCPWALPALFKGPECQYSGEDLICTGTFDDCYTKGNSVHWGGEVGLDPNAARV